MIYLYNKKGHGSPHGRGSWLDLIIFLGYIIFDMITSPFRRIFNKLKRK